MSAIRISIFRDLRDRPTEWIPGMMKFNLETVIAFCALAMIIAATAHAALSRNAAADMKDRPDMVRTALVSLGAGQYAR